MVRELHWIEFCLQELESFLFASGTRVVKRVVEAMEDCIRKIQIFKSSCIIQSYLLNGSVVPSFCKNQVHFSCFFLTL